MSITFEAAPQGEAVAPQEEIITSKIASGDEIFMDLEEGNQELTVTIKKAKNPAK